ncbi:hypothetical protein [Flavobacterium microcysteis]
MKTNRRKFIGTSSMTLVGIAFTNTLLGQSVSSLIKFTEETIPQKLKRAADLRRNGQGTSSLALRNRSGSGQNLEEALGIYNEVILTDAEEVRAYDGIRKILLQSKYKELEVLQVYSNYLVINTISPIFKERVAKEYMRLALGNKKFANQLNSPEDLLLASNTLLNQARSAEPDNEQFEVQYQKTVAKMTQQTVVLDARDNPALKALKKINRQNHKKRFDHLTAAQSKTLLDKLLAKKPNTDRNNHIREIHKVYINKLVKSGDVDSAAKELEALVKFDMNDVHALKMARKICIQHYKYGNLENIERENDKKKESFWSKTALFDILMKRYHKENIGSISELNDILSNAESKARSFGQFFEVSTRKIKVSIAQKIDPEVELGRFADSISGIKSSHAIDRFNMLCIAHYKEKNMRGHAVKVINIALRQNGLPLEEFLLQKVEEVNRHRISEKPIHDERLNYLRTQLFD